MPCSNKYEKRSSVLKGKWKTFDEGVLLQYETKVTVGSRCLLQQQRIITLILCIVFLCKSRRLLERFRQRTFKNTIPMRKYILPRKCYHMLLQLYNRQLTLAENYQQTFLFMLLKKDY